MKDLTIDEYLRYFPSLKSQKDKALFFTDVQYKEHLKSDLIASGSKNIRVALLEALFNDQYYYDKIEAFFNDSIIRIAINYLSFNGANIRQIVSKLELCNFLNKALKENLLNLSVEGKKRVNKILSMVTYDSFLNEHKDKILNLNIENNEVEVEVEDIIKVITLPEKEYKEFWEDKKSFKGMSKEYFAYCIKQFFTDYHIFGRFEMGDDLKRRFDDLRSYYDFDFEAVNEILKSDIEYIDEAIINPSVEKFLYNKMPENLDDLEKAIYLYIKACKLFSYDEKFYVDEQKGPVAIMHKDINHINEIDLENKDVVCYEFNAIYGKLLDKLGINFEIESELTKEYGFGHVKLVFKADKFLIQADSVTSIFQGDLVRAKVGFPIQGLKCTNVNEKTNEEFDEKLIKVQEIVNKEFREKNISNFKEAVNEYEKIDDHCEQVSLKDKIDILLSKTNESGLSRIELSGYLILLVRLLFTQEEKLNNVRVVICKELKGKKDNVRVVIAVNLESFLNEEKTKYILLDPNKKCMSISKDELQDLFDGGELTLGDKKELKIPGIRGR